MFLPPFTTLFLPITKLLFLPFISWATYCCLLLSTYPSCLISLRLFHQAPIPYSCSVTGGDPSSLNMPSPLSQLPLCCLRSPAWRSMTGAVMLNSQTCRKNKWIALKWSLISRKPKSFSSGASCGSSLIRECILLMDCHFWGNRPTSSTI